MLPEDFEEIQQGESGPSMALLEAREDVRQEDSGLNAAHLEVKEDIQRCLESENLCVTNNPERLFPLDEVSLRRRQHVGHLVAQRSWIFKQREISAANSGDEEALMKGDSKSLSMNRSKDDVSSMVSADQIRMAMSTIAESSRFITNLFLVMSGVFSPYFLVCMCAWGGD